MTGNDDAVATPPDAPERNAPRPAPRHHATPDHTPRDDAGQDRSTLDEASPVDAPPGGPTPGHTPTDNTGRNHPTLTDATPDDATPPNTVRENAYERLVADLDAAGARYRLIDHPPEGRTDRVSAMRGHHLYQAAKCLIVMVKIGKKRTRYVLAVVPGDARLDLDAVKSLLDGTYAAFATKEKAEELAGSVSGTVLPFSRHPRLELIADPALLKSPELFFNAARLDRSIALSTDDYVRLAAPRFETITMP